MISLYVLLNILVIYWFMMSKIQRQSNTKIQNSCQYFNKTYKNNMYIFTKINCCIFFSKFFQTIYIYDYYDFFVSLPPNIVVMVRTDVAPRGARAAALLQSIKNEINERLTTKELGMYTSFMQLDKSRWSSSLTSRQAYEPQRVFFFYFQIFVVVNF